MLIPVLKQSLGTWSEKSKVIFAWNWMDETILRQSLDGLWHLVAALNTRYSHWLNTSDGKALWRSRGRPRHGPSGLCHGTPQSGLRRKGLQHHLGFPRLAVDCVRSCTCFRPCAGRGLFDDHWMLSFAWISQDMVELHGGKLAGKKLWEMIDSNCLQWKKLIRAAQEHQVTN